MRKALLVATALLANGVAARRQDALPDMDKPLFTRAGLRMCKEQSTHLQLFALVNRGDTAGAERLLDAECLILDRDGLPVTVVEPPRSRVPTMTVRIVQPGGKLSNPVAVMATHLRN